MIHIGDRVRVKGRDGVAEVMELLDDGFMRVVYSGDRYRTVHRDNVTVCRALGRERLRADIASRLMAGMIGENRHGSFEMMAQVAVDGADALIAALER